MSRFRHTILITLIVALTSLSAFPAAMNESVTLRLVAYIPERTSFSVVADEFHVNSNANNFTYSVHHEELTRTLVVVAR